MGFCGPPPVILTVQVSVYWLPTAGLASEGVMETANVTEKMQGITYYAHHEVIMWF